MASSLPPGLALGLAALLASAPAAAADWDFSPRIRASQHWTDNVRAAPSGEEESEWITSVTPGFTVGMVGPRGTLDLDYDAQALWYRENSELDDVFHRLLGTGQLVLRPNRLFIDGFARYDQENIDPTRRITSGNIIRTGNRTDAMIYGFSPWYTSRVGSWGETDARFNYQGVRFRNTDDTAVRVQDSDLNSVSFRLGSPGDRPGLSWNTTASYQRTDFEFVPKFEYGRAAVDLGYPAGLRGRVTATYGLESNFLEDRSQGGFDEEFWLLGYAWTPTELQSFQVSVGRRFYGTTFGMDWTRRGTRGDLSVSYTEEPTTAGQNLFDGTGPQLGGRPGTPRLEPDVYLRKRLSVRSTYNLPRTRFTASIYGETREREIAEGGFEDEVYGIRLSADWDAAPRTRVNVAARAEYRDFGIALRDSELYSLSLSVRRNITRTLFGQFRASHVRRDFDLGDSYRINSASLSLGLEF